MRKIILNVDGMHCAACSAAVERAACKLNGVDNASVNLTAANALINFDEDKVSVDNIINAINNAGFSASVPVDKTKEELRVKTAQKARNSAIRLAMSVLFGVPLFYVAMGHMLGLPLPAFIDPSINASANAICQLILCIPVLISGSEFFKNAVQAAVHKNVNMDTLVSVGSAASFAYSIYSMIKIIGGETAYVHQLYFDSAGMIITFILIGRYLESFTKKKTNTAVEKLLDLSPATAIIFENGMEKEVSSDSLRCGDTVVLKSGMSVPVDGVVISGNCTVDESMLTGESLPVEKNEGDEIYGGTINTNGYVRYRVSVELNESTPARIAAYINEAQATKAPVAALANKIASVFVPVVILIAFAASLLWFVSGKDFAFSLKIFVSVLVIACPCSLGLATPTALSVSMGSSASKGILIKNGEALQRLSSVNTVVFDKTGTVTKGTPEVYGFQTYGSFDKKTAEEYFYSVESKSEHPLAKAICEYSKENGIGLIENNDFEALTGLGIKCRIGDNNVICGSYKLMTENGFDLSEAENFYSDVSSQGMTAIFLAVNGKIAASVSVADKIRDNAREAVNGLKKAGIKTVMLTGDNKNTAKAIASQVGIDEVFSELMPEDKLTMVNRIKLDKNVVAMVGDGINDAPSLTAADVGIAVGSGTDIAIESADIVLMNGDVSAVLSAIQISRRTMKIIRQNLFWAFAYNCICIPVAAGALYLFGGPLLNPMIAAAAMSLSSVTVVSNSLRLKRIKNK